MVRKFESKISAFLGLHEAEVGNTVLKKGESPNMKNLKITSNYSLKLREGYKKLFESVGEARGIHAFGGFVFFVLGSDVFRYKEGMSEKVGQLESETGRVTFLAFQSALYFLDGKRIKVYKKGVFGDIEPYVPLIAVSTNTAGAGTSFEKINLMSDKRRQSFTVDSERAYFTITEKNIDSVDEVRHLGEVMANTSYTVDLELGEIKLKGSVDHSPNAYEVTYTKVSGDKDKIHKMRYAVAWGGENDTRVFLWGDEDNPELYRYSESHDGKTGFDYFPELCVISTPSGSRVTSLLRHYDRLLVFTENETYYSFIEEKTDYNGINYFSYPLRLLSSTVGSSLPYTATIADNTPITLSNGVLYRFVSSVLRDEKNAVEIGSRIKRGIKEFASDYSTFDRSVAGELYFISKKGIYVYNYRLDLFYYYEIAGAKYFVEADDGNTYFIKDGSLSVLDSEPLDDGERIEFEWESGYTDTLGLKNKNIYSVAFDLVPDSVTFFDILWISESHVGKLSSLGLDWRVMNFEELYFDKFNFNTAVTPIKLSKRMKLKRVGGFKIILKNNSDGKDFHLTSLSVFGSTTDAK